MIVPTAPVIPSDHYGGIGPITLSILAGIGFANGIDDGGNPGGPSHGVRITRMIRILSNGNYPTHLRKVTVGDIVAETFDLASGWGRTWIMPAILAKL